jgi:DNA repair protein RadD
MVAPDLSKARIRSGDYAFEDLRQAMNGVVIGAAVAEYMRICRGVPAVVFCVDIGHSKSVAERFCESGVRALHVDGDTPAQERRAAVAALGSGELVITNCNLFDEGVDVPAIGAAILLRPTASLALYLQQVGCALRPARGKDRVIILDFTGNTARHGLPGEPREWSLEAKPRRPRERAGGPQLRRCPSCAALNRAGAHACAEDGADLKTPRERREIEMALQEAARRELEDQVAQMRFREQLDWAGADEQRLRLVARIRGYKSGWIYWRRKEMAEAIAGSRA